MFSSIWDVIKNYAGPKRRKMFLAEDIFQKNIFSRRHFSEKYFQQKTFFGIWCVHKIILNTKLFLVHLYILIKYNFYFYFSNYCKLVFLCCE